MEMNISNETMETVMNCMRSQKKSLEKQLRNEELTENKREIIAHQLQEVQDAIAVFEEFGF